MKLEELDDLVAWFNKNVLEIERFDCDRVTNVTSGSEASKVKIFEALHEQDDELSLIEYIIGVDDII